MKHSLNNNPCARAELIALRFRDTSERSALVAELFGAVDPKTCSDLLEDLFSAAKDLGFNADYAGVSLAFEWITGERIFA